MNESMAMNEPKRPFVLIVTQAEPGAWVMPVAHALQPAYEVAIRHESAGYMRQLIDQRAALVYVDGMRPDWHTWTTAAASSNATRRIPVFVVSDELNAHQVRMAGATDAIKPARLLRESHSFTQSHARIITPQEQETLDCDCQQALPAIAQEGIVRFNAGDYYAQHDLFEALWVETTSPVRDLYRAILQVGIAYYQIERGNYRGALKMLNRSLQWLLILPDVCQGVDVAQLRADSLAVRDELERLGENRLGEFNKKLMKAVVWHDALSHHDE